MPIPLPPTDARRPIALYDTECYPNYWLLKIRFKNGPLYAFQLVEGQSLSHADKERILTLFDLVTSVSFNGNYYDVPMICGALSGYDTTSLKMLNDRIIVDGLKPWELNLPEWKPADHIDLMEVAPGAGSQKQYAGRIHCRKMQDLPYDPGTTLTPMQMYDIYTYNDNDLDVLGELYDALQPQLEQRIALTERYGIDLRSKSDAQVAEAIIKHRCEQALGQRIYKQTIDWTYTFKFDAPDSIVFASPHLRRVLDTVKAATFRIRPPLSMRSDPDDVGKCIPLPPELEGLEVQIGNTIYTMGIGGLHSQDGRAVHKSDDANMILDVDVAAYYPSLMLRAGAWPPSLGETFLSVFESIKDERIAAKTLQGELKKAGDTSSAEYVKARNGNEGGKIQINGTFGKTGSVYSVLFAPKMLIQTTLSGQLSLLMLIEWLEHNGITVLSANTDGLLLRCPRRLHDAAKYLITEWEKRTGLEMEHTEYLALYQRDVNNYFAVKKGGEVKRKGEYATSGLAEKKNPDLEICSDAVAAFLATGKPISNTILECRDIRKFVTVIRVSGGGVKMWGDGPRKGALVRDVVPILQQHGWHKDGRKWRRGDIVADAHEAHKLCYAPQRPEYLGKVVRWYYGTNSPGPIVSATNGNNVSLSYGATPCMTLPDEFPTDIDYDWYLRKADDILKDIGYYLLTAPSTSV